MGFRDDRLREMMRIKGWEPGDLYRAADGKLSYPQINHYLKVKGTKGAGAPQCDALTTIVLALQVDADYLIDTDVRAEKETSLQAAANMSLDRYLGSQSRAGKPVSQADENELRYVAEHSARPPLWVADWEIHHERITVSAEARPEPPRPEPKQRIQRQRSLRP
jgi:hypothetical protein